MRRRSVQLTILILFIVALSVASLGFRDININAPGFPALVRGGDGPLGLKLGLDLSGGGHLVYQADTGTRIEVGFTDPTRGVIIESALDNLGIADYEVRPLDDRTYVVNTDLLDNATKESIQDSITYTQVELKFDPELDSPDSGLISDLVQEQELANFQVEAPGVDNFFRITSTSPLDEAQQDDLEEALAEGVGEIVEFAVTTHGVASFSLAETQPPTADQMEGVLDRINRRVNLFGTEEPIIQLFGEDRVIVQLPGASGSISEVEFAEATDAQAVKGVVEGQGYEDVTVEAASDTSYEIRTVSINLNQQQALRSALSSGVGAVTSFETTGGIEAAKALIGQTAQLVFKERTCSDVTCFTFTDAELGLTGDDLENAFASTDPNTGEWEVNIAFKERGTGIFADLTQRIVGVETKRIAVFLDDELLIAPVSQAWIRDGRSSITGSFSREEARTLAIQLEAGSLPVPLELIQESDVDALLGSESLKKSLQAGIIGLGLVLLFMIAYYRMAGVVAALALLFYTIVVLAVFKLVPVTLGLSGIGAFILSIGLAVDANILIFERMKEEIRIGRTLSSSMEVGFSRAWPAIRDGNFSTIITCLVLLWLGSRTADDLVTGFAFTLFIGVVVSMFTAIVVSRNLLQLLAWIGLGRRLNLFSPEGTPTLTSGARAGGAAGQTRNV
ncbi:MAG: protein translocase subunit SecD [Chloroflexi bacterium]|nr:protein translocase subunit SecD [Chloroflexota bacterium]